MRISPLLLFTLLASVACGSSADETKEFPAENAAKAIADYGRNVHANYTDVLSAAKAMQTAVGSFLATPTAATFDAAKKAWIDARVPYGPSEAFRFYDGPIDNP